MVKKLVVINISASHYRKEGNGEAEREAKEHT